MFGPGAAGGAGAGTGPPGSVSLGARRGGLPRPGRRPAPFAPAPPLPLSRAPRVPPSWGRPGRERRRGPAAAPPQAPDAPGPGGPAAPPAPGHRPRPAAPVEAAPWRAARAVPASGPRSGGDGCGGPGVAMVTGRGRRHSRAGPSASAGRGSARLSVGVSGGGAAGPGERARPGGLSMEDGFSSYSSLYDTSSLLQFCNGEGRRPGGRGPRRRAGPPGEAGAGRPRKVAAAARGSRRRGRIVQARGPRPARPRCLRPAPSRPRVRVRARPAGARGRPVPGTRGASAPVREARGEAGPPRARGRVARPPPNSGPPARLCGRNSENKSLSSVHSVVMCAVLWQLDPQEPFTATLVKSPPCNAVHRRSEPGWKVLALFCLWDGRFCFFVFVFLQEGNNNNW